jgi:hypothetical protein
MSAGTPWVARSRLGQRLAGFIYGTIVSLSVLVAGGRAFPHDPGRVAILVAVTSLVFWMAHVYAHAVSHSVEHNEHLSLAELGAIARREGSILEAAIPPVVVLLLGAIGVFAESTAVWVAMALGLVVLAAQGFVFARFERLGPLATIGVVAANLGFGLLLVALKVFLSH